MSLTCYPLERNEIYNFVKMGMNRKGGKIPTVHMYWVITKLGKRERGKMSFHCSSFYSKNNDHHFAKSDTFMDTLNEYRAFVFKEEAVCFALAFVEYLQCKSYMQKSWRFCWNVKYSKLISGPSLFLVLQQKQRPSFCKVGHIHGYIKWIPSICLQRRSRLLCSGFRRVPAM